MQRVLSEPAQAVVRADGERPPLRSLKHSALSHQSWPCTALPHIKEGPQPVHAPASAA